MRPTPLRVDSTPPRDSGADWQRANRYRGGNQRDPCLRIRPPTPAGGAVGSQWTATGERPSPQRSPRGRPRRGRPGDCREDSDGQGGPQDRLPVPTTTRMAPRTARVRFVLGVFVMHLQPRAVMPARPTVEVRADTATSITAPVSRGWNPGRPPKLACQLAPGCSHEGPVQGLLVGGGGEQGGRNAEQAHHGAARRHGPARGRDAPTPVGGDHHCGDEQQQGQERQQPGQLTPRTGSDGGARRRNRAPLPTSR